MIINTTAQHVKVKKKKIDYSEDEVRAELVEAMKVKYANIDLDAEIDRWLGVLTYRAVLDYRCTQ